MTQPFKNDNLELKFSGSAEKVFTELKQTLADWFENAYTDQKFGGVLYDNNVTPLTGTIARDIFIKNFNQIFEKWRYVGSFESYLYVFKHIFGESSRINFEKISPAHLKINITTDNTTLFKWIATTKDSASNFLEDEMTDELGNSIVFQQQLGINDFREVQAVLNSLNPAGIFLDVNFEIRPPAPSNCFYDRVSKKFFESMFTTPFVYGEDADGKFIENTSNAIINLGYKANQNTRVIVKVKKTDSKTNNAVFGARVTTSTPNNKYALFFPTYSGETTAAFQFANGGFGDTIIPGYAPGQIANFECKAGSLSFNGKVLATFAPEDFTSDLDFRLFNINHNGIATAQYFTGRIYGFKIYENDALLMDLIPVKKGE
ncbi:hypothetical protein Dip510_000067 [Elusimicrobium posterum]|uniref:hypothetical protein n=1 Tax=Elusimicrobium posterum TaxID=3116653 RepID=UPI003C7116E0